MKKNHLIPLGKGKRIIYLEHRGRAKSLKGWSTLFGVLGVLCLLYCLSIALFMGYGTSFFLIWGGLAVLCGIVSWTLAREDRWRRIPKLLRRIMVTCVILGIMIFVVVEGMILSRFAAKAQPDADYVIVLGAQWKENGPSYVLKKRLNKAIEYLNANPRTNVIVSVSCIIGIECNIIRVIVEGDCSVYLNIRTAVGVNTLCLVCKCIAVN